MVDMQSKEPIKQYKKLDNIVAETIQFMDRKHS